MPELKISCSLLIESRGRYNFSNLNRCIRRFCAEESLSKKDKQ